LFHIFDKLGVSSRVELALWVSSAKTEQTPAVQSDTQERKPVGSMKVVATAEHTVPSVCCCYSALLVGVNSDISRRQLPLQAWIQRCFG